MKISTKVQNALNKQMNKEFASSYLYMSMAAYLESENYKGMASWMHLQAAEENGHGTKIHKYILDRGGKPILEAMAKPKNTWKNPEAVFKNALAHEEEVTASINKLVKDTSEDQATQVFLQWFIQEQVEEEANVQEIVDKFNMIKGAPGALFMLDHQLGTRTNSTNQE